MTKSKWLRLLKSGSLLGVATSTTTALLSLKDYVSPKHAVWIVVACTLFTALCQSVPALVLEILDEGSSDVNLGTDKQTIS